MVLLTLAARRPTLVRYIERCGARPNGSSSPGMLLAGDAKKSVMFILDTGTIPPWTPKSNSSGIKVDTGQWIYFVNTWKSTVSSFRVSRRLGMGDAVTTFLNLSIRLPFLSGPMIWSSWWGLLVPTIAFI